MGRCLSAKGGVRMGYCGSGSVGVCVEYLWVFGWGRGINLDFSHRPVVLRLFFVTSQRVFVEGCMIT